MGKNNDVQFNLTSRVTICNGLKQGLSAKKIGLLTNHHGSSVSREVLKHRSVSENKTLNGSICSTCKLNRSCKKKKICGSILCRGDCKLCAEAKSCVNYEEIKCNIENRWPFICSPDCPYRKSCGKTKYEYLPDKANKESLIVRKKSREGLDMSKEDFELIDKYVSTKIKDGQSIFHICNTSEEINRSKSSIYEYVHKGILKTKIADLPRAPSFKRRKKIKKDYEYNENRNYCRDGHKYYDYLIYKSKNRVVTYWEMDFLGCPHDSEQEILTLVCPSIEFVLLFVLNRPIKKEAIVKVFDDLEEALGLELFYKLFKSYSY